MSEQDRSIARYQQRFQEVGVPEKPTNMPENIDPTPAGAEEQHPTRDGPLSASSGDEPVLDPVPILPFRLYGSISAQRQCKLEYQAALFMDGKSGDGVWVTKDRTTGAGIWRIRRVIGL